MKKKQNKNKQTTKKVAARNAIPEKKFQKYMNKDELTDNQAKEIKPPPIPAILTEEQIMEYRDAFDGMLELDSPKLPILSLINLLRQLCFMPSEEDVERALNEVVPDRTQIKEGLLFEHVCCVIAKLLDKEYKEANVINAFKVFDTKNEGVVHIDELKTLLLNMGEVFNQDELSSFVYCAQPDEKGFIDYEKFVKDMTEELNY